MYNYYLQMLNDFKYGVAWRDIEANMIKFGLMHEKIDPKTLLSFSSLQRDLGDLLNIFNISGVARSFTDIDEEIRMREEEIGSMATRKQLVKLHQIQSYWTEEVQEEVDSVLASLESKIKKGTENKLMLPKPPQSIASLMKDNLKGSIRN